MAAPPTSNALGASRDSSGAGSASVCPAEASCALRDVRCRTDDRRYNGNFVSATQAEETP